MSEIKKNCHWYSGEPCSKCAVLSELVCNKKKCTFFETEEKFQARQKKFAERTGRAQRTKRCKKCREVKDIIEFGTKTGSADGLDCYCRNCNREIARKYYFKNRGKRK